MFSNIELLPDDPILGLTQKFANDPRSEKIDLGIGVYRTVSGETPIMNAVKRAEEIVVAKEKTKSYTPATGAPGFTDSILKLVYGADNEDMAAGRCSAVQTPGGCGALRLAAELLERAGTKRIVTGAPTWANHIPLMAAAGHNVELIPYYNASSGAIDFEEFKACISALESSDVLLLHGACHNPTGADLSDEQIDEIIDLAIERKFLLLIDTAYHGFAVDLDADAYVIREATRRLPELLITYSCSKNFGLYRERTGALIVVGENADRANALRSHVVNIARGNYSMPPAHGGAIVAEILQSPELEELWRDELHEMAERVRSNRKLLVEAADKVGLGNRLAYIAAQSGMFSLLPMTTESVAEIIEKHGVYIVGAGRINLCGVNDGNVDYLVNAINDVLDA